MIKFLRAIQHPIQTFQNFLDGGDRWMERMDYQGRHWATA